MAKSNRRHFPRQKAEDTIEVLLIPDDFEGRKDSYDLIPAKMVNQSNNGLYIEIDRAFNPGRMSESRWSPRKDIILRKRTICAMDGSYGVKKLLTRPSVLGLVSKYSERSSRPVF